MANLTKTIEANGSKGHHKFSLIVEETYVGSGYQNTSDVSFTFKLSPVQNGWDWSGWASKITYKVTINGNEYTGSIGSYNGSSTVTLKSGSETIEHNSDGTKSISISFQVTDSSGQSYTCGNASKSDTFALSNIPRYATSNQSLSSATETSFSVSWWSDSTINAVWYSTDNGSSWTYINNPNSTSGSYTISNLQENTTYNIKTKVRRADSNLETQSSVGTWTTYSYPKAISSNNFTIGNGATVNLYNPLGRSVTLYILKVGETNNSNHLGYYSGTYNGYINAQFKTSDAISRQYASIPNNQNAKYYCRVVYGSITKDFTDNNNNTYSIAYNDNEKPVFNSSKISYTNSGSHSGFGDTNKFIKGHNNVTITIQPMTSNTSANGDYYTISSSGINTQTKTHTGSNITVSNFGNLSNSSITVTAVDKRGQSRGASVNVPWIDYFNPYISNTIINRENAIGEKAVINVTGKYMNWTGLNVNNAIQTVKYKIVGVHNSFQNMPSNAVLTNQNGDWTLTATLQDTLNISNTYEIQFQFTDKLETITATGYRIGTADALLWRDLQNKRIGIRMKPDYTLDVNGDIRTNGNIRVNNTIYTNTGLLYNLHRPTGSNEYGYVRILPNANYTSIVGSSDWDTTKYLKALLKWICKTYPNDEQCIYIGRASPNSQGIILIHIYNNSIVDSTTKLPQYSSGQYTEITTRIKTFGTTNYTYYEKDVAMYAELPNMTNVAYKNVNNNFTTGQSISGDVVSTGTIQWTANSKSSSNANDERYCRVQYWGSGNSNVPSAWTYILNMMNGGGDGAQLGIYVSDGTLYTRGRANGNWTNWLTMAHTGMLPSVNSNSYGYYIRFPNIKYQICWFEIGSKKVSGNTYADYWINFPASFSEAPCIVTSLGSDSTSSDMGYIFGGNADRYASGFTFRLFNRGSGERWPFLKYVAFGPYS